MLIAHIGTIILILAAIDAARNFAAKEYLTSIDQ
jgi:hypothetical protein